MIDVIIPVYNTPINDLKRCFDSVLKQTYKDYKVYIIDDGSNEETKKFIDIYTKDKKNFFVKHIVNGGASAARNIGLNLSKSKYVTFVDSDDTIYRGFLNQSIKYIEKYDLDVIIGGYNEIVNNKIVRIRKCMPGLHIYQDERLVLFFKKLLTSKTTKSNIEIGDCPTGRIYTRLFRRKSIDDLRFNENIRISEDTLFMIDYMYKVKKIGIVDKVWYNYYKNSYSITNNTNNKILISNVKSFIKQINDNLFNEQNKIIKDAYKGRIKKAKKYIEELKKH
ncbi:MAG: glycosyltransferase family 2 protein [Bacilli bacterium]|nr:glycosyltransferase family 2 protein [Bacilli bacterium]